MNQPDSYTLIVFNSNTALHAKQRFAKLKKNVSLFQIERGFESDREDLKSLINIIFTIIRINIPIIAS